MVAFSGGVDSTFLLKAASLALPKNRILAVTASSATYPRQELLFSKKIARALGVRHRVIKTQELKNSRFTANPLNRCYFCKKELFSRLKRIAKKSGLNFILDASNISDKKDFRPGNKAKYEFRVRSPLVEAGFTKEDIRRMSRKLGLATWKKPSLACLASRVPYGRRINPAILKRIEKGEEFLRRMGFKQVRLRHYQDLCRIELAGKELSRAIKAGDLIVEKLKGLGYNYITLDLEGYRTGSLNRTIKK